MLYVVLTMPTLNKAYLFIYLLSPSGILHVALITIKEYARIIKEFI